MRVMQETTYGCLLIRRLRDVVDSMSCSSRLQSIVFIACIRTCPKPRRLLRRNMLFANVLFRNGIVCGLESVKLSGIGVRKYEPTPHPE